jgi:hypothetical protein
MPMLMMLCSSFSGSNTRGVTVTEDVGVTCDLLDSSTSEPHPTSFICDKCKISLVSDNIACVKSQIIVENEALVGK